MLVELPAPFDFALSVERFGAFGLDLANAWDGHGLTRVLAGRVVRLSAAPGGLEVTPDGDEVAAAARPARPAPARGGRPARPDTEVAARLGAWPGMGEWTAAWSPARHLGRPRAWPAGDLGVRKALARFYLDGRDPSLREARALG